MDDELLSDKKYEELLRSRTNALTKNQIQQLREIERISVVLNEYQEGLSEEQIGQMFNSLRRRQMEILTNEREEPLDRVLDVLPDEITTNFNFPGL